MPMTKEELMAALPHTLRFATSLGNATVHRFDRIQEERDGPAEDIVQVRFEGDFSGSVLPAERFVSLIGYAIVSDEQVRNAVVDVKNHLLGGVEMAAEIRQAHNYPRMKEIPEAVRLKILVDAVTRKAELDEQLNNRTSAAQARDKEIERFSINDAGLALIAAALAKCEEYDPDGAPWTGQVRKAAFIEAMHNWLRDDAK